MDYKKWSKEDLVKRIDALERLNDYLVANDNEQSAMQFGWAGNLGHWYWDVPTNRVTFNPLKITTLGFQMSDIEQPVPYNFFTTRLHPDDYQRTMDCMIEHLAGRTHVYEVEYRIQAKDGSYKWYYDRGSIIKRDDNGKALLLAGIVFDITDRKIKESQLLSENENLKDLVEIDELTQIANRRSILTHLQSQIHQSQSNGMPTTVLLLDIDNFKGINDQYGHLFGDRILHTVAQVIARNLREDDRVGRYGGEEFLVVLSQVDLDIAHRIAERIRGAIESTSVDDVHVTISGGIYQRLGTSSTDLIQYADVNLYEAKKRGKNQII